MWPQMVPLRYGYLLGLRAKDEGAIDITLQTVGT